MSFSINVKVDKLNELKKYVDYVKYLSKMQKDKKFQKFIQDKCLETVRRITEQRLTGGTTNDDLIGEYKARHKIKEEINGFVLYNDTILPSSMISTKHLEDYPNGFSVALAFEYGVGIVGQNNPVAGAWEYNLKDYNFGWYYQNYGEVFHTYGYSGFEIYRYTAIEIENKLHDWVIEYIEKERGVKND